MNFGRVWMVDVRLLLLLMEEHGFGFFGWDYADSCGGIRRQSDM